MFHCFWLSFEIFLRSMFKSAPGFPMLGEDTGHSLPKHRASMKAPCEGLNCVWTFFIPCFKFFKLFLLKCDIDEEVFLLTGFILCHKFYLYLVCTLRNHKGTIWLHPCHFYLYSHYSSLLWSNKIIITWIKKFWKDLKTKH